MSELPVANAVINGVRHEREYTEGRQLCDHARDPHQHLAEHRQRLEYGFFFR